MTRAVSCAIHGRLRSAVRYNPLVVIVLPLAAYEGFRFVREAVYDFTSAN
jgi:Protein of unknown function (DUF2752)